MLLQDSSCRPWVQEGLRRRARGLQGPNPAPSSREDRGAARRSPERRGRRPTCPARAWRPRSSGSLRNVTGRECLFVSVIDVVRSLEQRTRSELWVLLTFSGTLGIFFNYGSICWFGKDIQLSLFIAYLTLLNLTYVMLLELRSTSPYKGTLRPSTPAPAGEAQILSDTIEINYKYLVKNLPDATNEKLDVPGFAGLPTGLIST